MNEDLDASLFVELMPQFCGISPLALPMLERYIALANKVVCCSKWGVKCEQGRLMYVAHFISQFLEMLAAAESNPAEGGGSNLTASRVAMEKVGEVEVRYRATDSSTKDVDSTTKEFSGTFYGKQFLSLLRSLGCSFTTTSACHIA